jgi:acyl dehydratase
MKERYFDDLKTGDRFKSEPLNVTVKEVVEFAHKFDPQMFHLSRSRAERSIFKGLIASGWHTAAMSMRLFVKTLNFAEGAIGLGVDELRWPNAVRPGDVVTVDTEILELRSSRSDRAMGFFACATSRLISVAKSCKQCWRARWCRSALNINSAASKKRI